MVAVADLGRAPTAGSRAPTWRSVASRARWAIPMARGSGCGYPSPPVIPCGCGSWWSSARRRARAGGGVASADLRRGLPRPATPDPQRHAPRPDRASRRRGLRLCARGGPPARRTRRTRLVAGRRGSGLPPLPQSAEDRCRPGAQLEMRIHVRAPAGGASYGADGPPVAGARAARRADRSAAAGAHDARANPGHLSYSALADYAGCGYRFYVERVLGLASPLSPVPPPTRWQKATRARRPDELIDPELGPRERSLGIGNAVHAALEGAPGAAWAPAAGRAARAHAGRRGDRRSPRGAALASSRAGRDWLGSALRAASSVGAASSCARRCRSSRAPGDGDPRPDRPAGRDPPLPGGRVVDYKTDALAGREPAELAERYAPSARSTRSPRGQLRHPGDRRVALHVFLEAPDDRSRRSIGADGSRRARTRLERIVERMRARRLRARPPSPTRRPVFGCPAAARLCAAGGEVGGSRG